MRLGLIGLSRIGSLHADTLSSLDAVDELVVTGAVPAAIERVADKYGAEPAANATELPHAGVDGVVIAAATDAHPQLILAAVEAGLPVFCEKPVANGAAEAAEVLKRCAGATVQIGYQDAGQCSALQGEGGRPAREGRQARACSRPGGSAARCTDAAHSAVPRRRSPRSTSPSRAGWPGSSGVPGRGTPAASVGWTRP